VLTGASGGALSPADSPPRSGAAGLTVSSPSDPAEREADALAARALSVSAAPERSSRAEIQRRGEGAPALTPAVAAAAGAIGGGGEPLPSTERRFFEERFGHELSSVRVHADKPAAEAARALRADAFTLGRDVAFAEGRYDPGSDSGRRLLAHELVHVIQQGAAAPLAGGGARGPVATTGGGPRIARQAAEGVRPVEPGTVPPMIRRDPDPTLAAAVAARDWRKAAEFLNGLDASAMQAQLATLGRGAIASIHVGALENPRLGPRSAVANATRAVYLDLNYENELKKKNWPQVARFLNGFNRDDMLVRLRRLDPAQVQSIHDAAATSPALGAGAQVVQLSQQVVAQAKAPKTVGEAVGEEDTRLSFTGNPVGHPAYIEKTTKGIRIPIWGGPLYLLQTDNSANLADSVVVDRRDFDFGVVAEQQIDTIYRTRELALQALARFGAQGLYTFYQGKMGRILPTVLSTTTAPGITRTALLAIEGEGKDAQAAQKLGVNLLFWHLGARFPVKTATGAPAAAQASSSLRQILGASQYAALRASAETAKATRPELAALAIDEIIAIRAYSAESWAILNSALRLKDAKELTRLGEFINLMKSGLSKLPIFKGTVNRTIGMQVGDAAAKYRVGATVVEDAFTSATFGKTVAQREGNVLQIIESANGRNITAVAVHAESEVLFAPGAKFIVTEVTRIGSAFIVKLKEIF
jgi:hypothetical protein